MFSEEFFTQLVESSRLTEVAESIFKNSAFCSKDWLSCFSHGLIYFLNDVLSLNEIVSKSQKYATFLSSDKVESLSWLMISFLLPGDEWILQQSLDRLKLTQDSFLKTIFTLDILTLSKGLYLPSPSIPTPSSFLMDSKSATILPLREYWCFEFPVTLKDNSAPCRLPDLLSWLDFVDKVPASQGDSFKSYHLYSMLNVFLLQDDAGDYHFLDPLVSTRVGKIVQRIVKNGKELSDFHRLYPLYLELLDHYQAVSYGDQLFGKCLLFLCQMRFPYDFRLAFWSRMPLYLNHFNFDCNEVFGNFRDYICPKEVNRDVAAQRAIAMKSGKMLTSENSAIATLLKQ